MKNTPGRNKNWAYGLVLFLFFMFTLMINDAINYPEDFVKGFDSVIGNKQTSKWK